MNPTLTKNYDASAVIAAHRIVKPSGANDYEVSQAAASTDALVGVSDLGATAAGDRVDVIHAGIAKLEYGGAIAAGDLLTADANGKAVAESAAAGANARVIGIALIAGAAGDIGEVLLQPGQVQG